MKKKFFMVFPNISKEITEEIYNEIKKNALANTSKSQAPIHIELRIDEGDDAIIKTSIQIPVEYETWKEANQLAHKK